MPRIDDTVLYDVEVMLAGDPTQQLRAVASAGAQVRRSSAMQDADGIARIARDGRPRGVVLVGSSTAAMVGDVLAAVAGPGCAVPLQTVRSRSLPGWAGPLDLAVAVSLRGDEPDALEAAAVAAHRGCRLVGVGARRTPLQELVDSIGGLFLEVDPEGLPERACLWTMAAPVLLLAAALGVVSLTSSDLAVAADTLDEVAEANGVTVPPEDNEAKTLALAVAESIPVLWGDSPLATVAAMRGAAQLGQNALLPACWGGLPGAALSQAKMFAGPYGSGGDGGDDVDELFRDPFEDGPIGPELRLLLLHDPDAHPRDELLGQQALMGVRHGHQLPAPAGHPLVRLAALVGILDWISVYAALACGVDPGGRE